MQKADVEAILDEVTLTPEMFRDLTGALPKPSDPNESGSPRLGSGAFTGHDG